MNRVLLIVGVAATLCACGEPKEATSGAVGIGLVSFPSEDAHVTNPPVVTPTSCTLTYSRKGPKREDVLGFATTIDLNSAPPSTMGLETHLRLQHKRYAICRVLEPGDRFLIEQLGIAAD